MNILRYEQTVTRIAFLYSDLGLSFKDLRQEGWVGLLNFKKGQSAVLCVKHAICRALSNQATVVRLPEYLVGRIMKINDGDTEGLSPLQIRRAQLASKYAVSFDEELESGFSRHEVIGDTREYDPTPDRACKLIATLSDRERYVIERNFGLNGQDETSLEVIAPQLGIRRSMASKLKQQALRKLRAQLEKESE